MGSIGLAELVVIALIGAVLLVPAIVAIVYIMNNAKKGDPPPGA